MASHSQGVPEQPNSTFPMLINTARHEEEEMPNKQYKATVNAERLLIVFNFCSAK